MLLLVGDNPFHGISHLSQARARSRDPRVLDSSYAATLIVKAVDRGANGFMFSISTKTLAILGNLVKAIDVSKLTLVAIAPYAYEYVRKATVVGPIGLAKEFVKNVLQTLNVSAAIYVLKAFAKVDLVEGLKALIDYELNRVRRAGGSSSLYSLMLHELIVDTLIAYGLSDMVAEVLNHIAKRGVTPGVETRNLPYVYRALKEYPDVFEKTLFSTPFNKMGFQMAPSKHLYEEIVKEAPRKVIALSILAAGLIKPQEALKYIARFRDHLLGIAVGVSKEHHTETFEIARKILEAP